MCEMFFLKKVIESPLPKKNHIKMISLKKVLLSTTYRTPRKSTSAAAASSPSKLSKAAARRLALAVGRFGGCWVSRLGVFRSKAKHEKKPRKNGRQNGRDIFFNRFLLRCSKLGIARKSRTSCSPPKKKLVVLTNIKLRITRNTA